MESSSEQHQGSDDEVVQGDQGAPVDPTAPQQSGGFNPDEPVRTSAPPAEGASGVPDLPNGANEGVEPGEPGPVEGGGQSPDGPHPEANEGGPEAETTGDPNPAQEPQE